MMEQGNALIKQARRDLKEAGLIEADQPTPRPKESPIPAPPSIRNSVVEKSTSPLQPATKMITDAAERSAEKNDKIERIDRSEKGDKTEKVERNERLERTPTKKKEKRHSASSPSKEDSKIEDEITSLLVNITFVRAFYRCSAYLCNWGHHYCRL